MQKSNFRVLTYIFLAIAAFGLNACNSGNPSNTTSGGTDPNDTAATVNGKAIKMEEVERGLKQQAQGQNINLSPLELAAARLQILEGLIQQEVMFQKAEKEATVPTDEEVTAELNRLKTQSGRSAEQFEKEMQTAGETEQSLREKIKKQLAIKKLIDKITGKIEPPKDKEIEDFYNGNKEAFVKKKGVRLAAIVVDPANNGQGDTTTNEQEAVLKGNEIIKQLQQGIDFATLAREKSEDQSKFQGGDLGYVSEEQMKQTFPPQVAATLMNPEFKVGQLLPTPMQGKFYIFKLQERSDRDENLTLESPGIREQVTNSLIASRKEILSQSYAAVAMNEAKIENFLAQKVINNPNELSGARPASAVTPAANANANAANVNSNTANVNSAANSNANVKANTNTSAANKVNANK